MDPVSHLAIGALAGNTISRLHKSRSKSVQLTIIGALAGIAPDIDILAYAFDPAYYDAYLHRTYTHSIILAPVLATILAIILLGVFRSSITKRKLKQISFRWIWLVCLAGVLSHIAADMLTAWELGWLMPLYNERFSAAWIFIIDLGFTGVLFAALIISLLRVRGALFIAWCFPIAWVVYAASMKEQALQAGLLSAPASQEITKLEAWPQPFSVKHWKLIASTESGFWQAHIRLSEQKPIHWPFGWMTRSAHSYQTMPTRREATVEWAYFERAGVENHLRDSWHHSQFEPVRDFMTYPTPLAHLADTDRECQWFTDLLYTVPQLDPAFQYGMCLTAEGTWERVKKAPEFPRSEQPP